MASEGLPYAERVLPGTSCAKGRHLSLISPAAHPIGEELYSSLHRMGEISP